MEECFFFRWILFAPRSNPHIFINNRGLPLEGAFPEVLFARLLGVNIQWSDI